MFEFPKPVCDECGRTIPLERSPVWDIHASTMFCSFKCATKHRIARDKRAAAPARGPDRPAEPQA